MHEIHDIEIELKHEAMRLGERYGNVPVVIIIAGSQETKVPRCMIGSNMRGRYRLRDLLGILQTAIQIETLKHFKIPPFGPGN
jgi:hypothetical protein